MEPITYLTCECGQQHWLIYRAEIERGNQVVTRDIYQCSECGAEHAGEDISVRSEDVWREPQARDDTSLSRTENGPEKSTSRFRGFWRVRTGSRADASTR